MEKGKFYIAECCGSCQKGKKEKMYIKCQKVDGLEMFCWGLCSEYARNKDMIYPLPRKYVIGGFDSRHNIIWVRNEP